MRSIPFFLYVLVQFFLSSCYSTVFFFSFSNSHFSSYLSSISFILYLSLSVLFLSLSFSACFALLVIFHFVSLSIQFHAAIVFLSLSIQFISFFPQAFSLPRASNLSNLYESSPPSPPPLYSSHHHTSFLFPCIPSTLFILLSFPLLSPPPKTLLSTRPQLDR